MKTLPNEELGGGGSFNWAFGIWHLLAHGMTEEQIRAEHPGLNREDVQACLLFVTWAMKNTDFMPLAEQASFSLDKTLLIIYNI